MRAALVIHDLISNIIELDDFSSIDNVQYLSSKSKLKIGDIYDIEKAHCGELPPIKVLDIVLDNIFVTSPNAKLIGNIWWLPKDEPFTITANATGLPDGGLMVMVERVINATQPVDDIRFVANIKGGIVTMQGKFEQSGNYIITAKRLNAGLERIEAPFRLAFDTLEFDVYVSA